MALEVNNQNLFQNAQFQQFVEFAEAAAKAGKQKAIARLDYSKFDDTEANELFNSKQDMPDGTRKFAEQRNMKVVESFPDDFKISDHCTLGFQVVLNPSDEDLIEAQCQ